MRKTSLMMFAFFLALAVGTSLALTAKNPSGPNAKSTPQAVPAAQNIQTGPAVYTSAKNSPAAPGGQYQNKGQYHG
jgi:hypothetical protein